MFKINKTMCCWPKYSPFYGSARDWYWLTHCWKRSQLNTCTDNLWSSLGVKCKVRLLNTACRELRGVFTMGALMRLWTAWSFHGTEQDMGPTRLDIIPRLSSMNPILPSPLPDGKLVHRRVYPGSTSPVSICTRVDEKKEREAKFLVWGNNTTARLPGVPKCELLTARLNKLCYNGI